MKVVVTVLRALGLVILAVIPGGFLLLALYIGARMALRKNRKMHRLAWRPPSCDLCTPEEQAKCGDPMCQLNDAPPWEIEEVKIER